MEMDGGYGRYTEVEEKQAGQVWLRSYMEGIKEDVV